MRDNVRVQKVARRQSRQRTYQRSANAATGMQQAGVNDPNTSTIESVDRKRRLHLTIVQRTSVDDVPTPTESSEPGSSGSSNGGDSVSPTDDVSPAKIAKRYVDDELARQPLTDESIKRSTPPSEDGNAVGELIVTNRGKYQLSSVGAIVAGDPRLANCLETKRNVLIQVLEDRDRHHYKSLVSRLTEEGWDLWRRNDGLVPYTYDELCHLVLHRDSMMAEDAQQRGRFYFIEPQPGPTLHHYIQKRRQLDEAEAQRLFRQLCAILAFCHQLGIVIRDLKLRKLVFEDNTWSEMRLASPIELHVLPDPLDDRLSDRHGCPAYVSPEIVSLNETTYGGRAADMWSAGVLLYVMFVGRYPFYDNTAVRLFEKIRRGDFHLPGALDLTLDARIILHSLLRLDPKRRPSALRLLRMSWMQPGAVQCVRKLAPPPPHKRFDDGKGDHLVPVVNLEQLPHLHTHQHQQSNSTQNTTQPQQSAVQSNNR